MLLYDLEMLLYDLSASIPRNLSTPWKMLQSGVLTEDSSVINIRKRTRPCSTRGEPSGDTIALLNNLSIVNVDDE